MLRKKNGYCIASPLLCITVVPSSCVRGESGYMYLRATIFNDN